MRAYDGGEIIDCGGQVVGLAGEEDEVVGFSDLTGEDGGWGGQVEVAVRAADVQALLGEALGGGGTDEEGNVLAFRRALHGQEACAEVAAESAGADDEGSHGYQGKWSGW